MTLNAMTIAESSELSAATDSHIAALPAQAYTGKAKKNGKDEKKLR
jgi:hypothetical protein